MTATFTQLVQSLNARAGSSGWYYACCPAHSDRSPSLSFRRGDYRPVLFHCFAHCGDEEIIAALEERDLWPLEDDDGTEAIPPPRAASDQRQREIDDKLLPLAGSLAERYLRHRAITLQPDDLGYHRRLWHRWSASAWPAMCACIRDAADRPMALQATFLHRVVAFGKAPVDPVRMNIGPLRRHAVHLAPAGRTLLIGEGIETTLSAMELTGLPGWATLGDANMKNVRLPSVVREVIVLQDNDETGERVADYAAWRFKQMGLIARIAIPPDGYNDFNDVMTGRRS